MTYLPADQELSDNFDGWNAFLEHPMSVGFNMTFKKPELVQTEDIMILRVKEASEQRLLQSSSSSDSEGGFFDIFQPGLKTSWHMVPQINKEV